MKTDRVSSYVHMRRDNPLPLYAAVNILDEPPINQLRAYLTDGPFPNQKSYNDIQKLYSLEHKHWKK